LKVNFGYDKWKKNNNIIWDTEKTINGHMILVGASGTGKTFTIRKILSELSKDPNIKIHIIDVHGDINIDGASSVDFSETSGYGLNPLKISADKDFGGVRKKIRMFVSMLNRTSRKLGTKQESVLINLLEDLYYQNGFEISNSKTWSVDYKNTKYTKKYPSISDLSRFANYKLKQILVGTSSKALSNLEKLNKKFMSLEKKAIKLKEGEDHDLDKLKEECKTIYTNYIDSIENGREIDDLIKYDSKDVIKSVYERIQLLQSSGIFKNKIPPFDDNNNVRRYNIKSLNVDEQKMFLDVLAEDIFFNAKQKGETDKPREFIVIDEAHLFMSDDNEHILVKIALEARKYGLGLILASQAFHHFSEDIISNTSCKVCLGLDEMYHITSAKKLTIEPKRFKYIIPHKSALIQVKEKGSISNMFYDTIF
jgi:DNA helicase HerA-like ATPase